MVGGSGSERTNSLFNLLNQQPDVDNIYLYAKDKYEAKYQFLINRWEDVRTTLTNDSKAFIKYSYNEQKVYKNI